VTLSLLQNKAGWRRTVSLLHFKHSAKMDIDRDVAIMDTHSKSY